MRYVCNINIMDKTEERKRLRLEDVRPGDVVRVEGERAGLALADELQWAYFFVDCADSESSEWYPDLLPEEGMIYSATAEERALVKERYMECLCPFEKDTLEEELVEAIAKAMLDPEAEEEERDRLLTTTDLLTGMQRLLGDRDFEIYTLKLQVERLEKQLREAKGE